MSRLDKGKFNRRFRRRFNKAPAPYKTIGDYGFTGILVITVSDALCLRNCNFLTRRDLSFIFKYVVIIDMNFIYTKLLVLKL